MGQLLVQPISVGGLTKRSPAPPLGQQAYLQALRLSVLGGFWSKVVFLERRPLDYFFAFVWLFVFESHFYRVLVWEFVVELLLLRHVFVEDAFLSLVELKLSDVVRSLDCALFI